MVWATHRASDPGAADQRRHRHRRAPGDLARAGRAWTPRPHRRPSAARRAVTTPIGYVQYAQAGGEDPKTVEPRAGVPRARRPRRHAARSSSAVSLVARRAMRADRGLTARRPRGRPDARSGHHAARSRGRTTRWRIWPTPSRTCSGSWSAARGETEATLARQRKFVADASHELRTPLTSILANLELLEAELAGEQRDMAELRVALVAADAAARGRPAAARPRRRRPRDGARAPWTSPPWRREAAREAGALSAEHPVVARRSRGP